MLKELESLKEILKTPIDLEYFEQNWRKVKKENEQFDKNMRKVSKVTPLTLLKVIF